MTAEWPIARIRTTIGKKMLKKNFKQRSSLFVGLGLAGLILLVSPPLAFSQSCALCYTQAASAGARMIEALRSGILILVVPPTLMSIGMVFIVARKRNQFRQDDESLNSEQKW